VRSRRRDTRTGTPARMGAREPRSGLDGRGARTARPDVAAELCETVSGGDGHDAPSVADSPTTAGGSAPVGIDGRIDRRSCRARGNADRRDAEASFPSKLPNLAGRVPSAIHDSFDAAFALAAEGSSQHLRPGGGRRWWLEDLREAGAGRDRRDCNLVRVTCQPFHLRPRLRTMTCCRTFATRFGP